MNFTELLAIRNGAWSYEKLIAWAQDQDGKLEALYKESTLPHKVDMNKLDNLCQRVVESML